MNKTVLAAVLAVFLAVFLVVQGAAAEVNSRVGQEEGGQQRYVTLELRDVDIGLFIKYISELTKKNFIVDRDVKGTVTVLSPNRISVDDAYKVFESVLEVHGYAAVPSGSVTKIVPSVQARSKSVATLHDGALRPDDDRVVTQIISLKHADATEVKTLLTPLVSKSSVLIAHAASNLVILTDYASNIVRLQEIIRSLDVPSEREEMLILPLHNASAEGVAKTVGQLFAPTGGQQGKRISTVRVIPFERTNTLIVFAARKMAPQIRTLVQRLDADVPRQEGNLRVIYLQHANAEELVKVLMNLPDNAPGGGANSATSAPQTPALSSDVKIVADKETNALIITGSRESYEVVAGVIKQLDVPRRMVYLEALIMEVKISKDFNIGVEWATGDGSVITGFSGSGGAPYGRLGPMRTNPGTLPPGFSMGVLGDGIRIGDVIFPNIGAVVNAYKSDSDVNVIATPQILTTDNKKATIKVGENVPYITSRNTTDAQQDYTNYDYKDVATSLTITPQVNQAEVVRLEIGVEVVKLKDAAATTNTPSTFTRTADTTVVVHNNETVVIGGMIGQDTNTSEYKVPLLGDIPVLGWLFKSHGSKQEKTNLYIFITPHIVENPAEIASMYYKKRDDMEAVHRQPGDIADRFFHPQPQPSHSAALSDIGFAKLQEGDLRRAREYFDQAIKNDPKNAAALINLATVNEREGKKEEAVRLYKKVLALPEPAKGGSSGLRADDPLRKTARDGLQRLEGRRRV